MKPISKRQPLAAAGDDPHANGQTRMLSRHAADAAPCLQPAGHFLPDDDYYVSRQGIAPRPGLAT